MKLVSTDMSKENLLKEETLFHVANGYLGVRGNKEEGTDDPKSIRGCYINGFYDTVELTYPERLYGFPQHAQRMINLPDIQSMKLYYNSEPLGSIAEYERILDTSDAITKRCIKYNVDSGFITVTYTRLASFTNPELFLTIMEIESDNVSGELKIHSGINCDVQNYTNPDDPRVAAEAIKHIQPKSAQKLQDGGFVICETTGSSLSFAVVQRFKADLGKIETKLHEFGTETEISVNITTGKTITIEKYTVLSDSRKQSEPIEYALSVAEKCMNKTAAAIIEEQKKYLADFWELAAIEIKGDKEVQDALEFNLFQLLQSTGQDGISSIAAKGISGEGYEGHYFWDSEIYIFPFFLFTKPDIARAMLDYRCSILDGAREHAKIMGHKSGALFPWRTISGSECSSYFPSGSAQYHINGDIAHAFMQYYYATGDLEYMEKKGAEVLIETARLWLDTGHFDSKGRFNIHAITGPDEYTCIVNNNYYTNRCAEANLHGAAKIYRLLKQKGTADCVESKTGITEHEITKFEKAASSMLLPYDAERDINAQDDSFLSKPIWDLSKTPKDKFPLLLNYHPLHLYRYQVCKQADTVMAHLLFEDGVEESTIKNSYEYYEQITTHDSSLSRCAFSIMAARLGMDDKAYEYFDDVIWTDIRDLHGNVKDGLHTANLGGSWLAVVKGFAGMRLGEKGLCFRFTKPKGWESYSFNFCYQKSVLQIHVNNENAEVILKEGKPLEIFVNDMQINLDEVGIKVIQSLEFTFKT